VGEVTNSYSGVAGVNNGSGPGVYGSSSTGYAGYFINNVYINGSVYPPSDARLKKDITPLSGAIEQLLKLKGVTYEWREPEKHNNATGKQIGFIAQDVEKVFPNWVRTNDDGYKVLSVSQIEALEVESIRVLKAKNDDLEARLAALEANRRPLISGLTAEAGLFGIGFVTMAGAFVVSRRKRSDGVQG
jgi:hypothetical protein